MAHVPLFIDLTDRCIVIFGGGRVGERKAKMFCAYGQTTVISTSFTAELLKMAESGLIDVIADDLKDVKKYLAGAFIVVPATNNRPLNTYIADQAKAMNILVNQVVDEDIHCLRLVGDIRVEGAIVGCRNDDKSTCKVLLHIFQVCLLYTSDAADDLLCVD